MTNIFLIMLVTTNWTKFPGHVKIEGTNTSEHQYQLIQTNQYREQVITFTITNRLSGMLIGESTNGVERWTPTKDPPIPTKL